MKILNFSLLVLILSGFTAYSQAPASWTVNPGDYNHSMQVTCKLNQACVDLANPNNKVAAFVNGVCRGVVNSNIVVGSDYLALLVIHSNSVAGEKIKFAFYNASTNSVVNGIDSIFFNSGSQVGGLTSPYFVTDNHAPTNIMVSSLNFFEDIINGGIIGSLSATDDVGSSFTYSLGAGILDNNSFGINGNNLDANDAFDYEFDSTKSIEIMVTDNGGCTLSKAFDLLVMDVNENPTALNLTSPLVSDHQQANSLMGKFSTIDPDFTENFTYMLVTGTGDADNGQFYIQNDTLFNVSEIDHAAQSSYTIRARSTDKGGLFIENVFTINVSNVNDAPTDIILSNNALDENMPVGTTIGTLSVIDADIADTHTLVFVSGSGSANNASVIIVGNELKTNEVFNFEQLDTLTIRIQANDPFNATYTKIFNILVNDVDETPTDINLSNDSILEGLPVATLVGKLTSIDEDIPSRFVYTLVSGAGDSDNSLFSILSDSLVSAQTYYYTGQSYNIRIRTTDSTGLFYEEAFIIGVRDSNYVPTDIISSILSFDENIAVGTTVATLSTIDYDSTDTHVYSFASGTDSTYFKIVGNQIITDSIVNFEIKSSYTFSINTTDPLNASFVKQFTFSVNDLNETPTDILLSHDTIQEGWPAGTLVGLFSSIDEDNLNTFTYTLVTGAGDTDNALFAINSDSLVSAISFVYPAPLYSVRIRTTDNGGLFYEEIFTVAIRDSNYVPTDITVSANSFDENIAIGTTIANLTTDDVDVSDTHNYTFTGGAASADSIYFDIIGSTLATKLAINYEVKNTFSITLKSTDPGNASFTKSFVFAANDLNEAPTDISLSNDTIQELQSVGTFIGDFSSIDEDGGATHTYSLVSGSGDTDNSLFSISGNQLVSGDNFSFSGQIYSIRVASIDNGGLTYEEVFNIKVTNLNETPYDIIIDTLKINEDNTPMFFVSTIKSADIDFPDFFTYQLVSGDGDSDNDQFTLQDNKLFINHKTNFDVKSSYHFRIQTSDLAGASFEKSFVLEVSDIAGNSIALPSANYISPNGDGKNDYWTIENVEVYKEFSLQIFDQFGQIVHSVANNYSNNWDARLNGTALPTGNYYFVFKNDRKSYRGNITVVNN